MRIRRMVPLLISVALTLTCISMSNSAIAGDYRIGVAGFGGFNQYGMRDANVAIQDINELIAASQRSSLESIEGGAGLGGGLRVGLRQNVLVSLDYTRLVASSSTELNDVSIELKLPGNSYTLTGTYFFPSDSNIGYGIGLGVGYYECSGHFGAGPDTVEGFSGNGLGAHFLSTVDAVLARSLHLEASAGLRYAKTTNLERPRRLGESDGVEIYNSNGGKVRADWSGALIRVGLTYYLKGNVE